jgi:hypothetical protein
MQELSELDESRAGLPPAPSAPSPSALAPSPR